MTTIAVRSITAPRSLQWWEWGKLLGAVGAAVLALAFVLPTSPPPPAVTAVVLHLTADFTAQSDETAMNKGKRGRHLLVHAVSAGGLPLAIAGLSVGPAAALAWPLIGAAAHYLVDWTRKYGVESVGLGAVLDQGSHLLVALALTLA